MLSENLLRIKQKTQENGTFMLTVTGVQTSLSEEDWLLCHTDEFKEENGDWELHALGNVILVDGITEHTNKLINQIANETDLRISASVSVGNSPSRAGVKTSAGSAHAGASIISRAGSGTDSNEPPREYERLIEIKETVLPLITEWAKKNNIWIQDIDSHFSNIEKIGIDDEGNDIGGEAKVWLHESGCHVIKAISLDYFVDPKLALERIELHNRIFPESHMETLGFGLDNDNEFRIIVKQPFIQGTRPTEKEINTFIQNLGLKPCPRYGLNTFCNDYIIISDLHDENLVKTKNGTLIPIDADIRANTPGMGIGGKALYKDTCKLQLTSNDEPRQEDIENFKKKHIQVQNRPKF